MYNRFAQAQSVTCDIALPFSAIYFHLLPTGCDSKMFRIESFRNMHFLGRNFFFLNERVLHLWQNREKWRGNLIDLHNWFGTGSKNLERMFPLNYEIKFLTILPFSSCMKLYYSTKKEWKIAFLNVLLFRIKNFLL